MNPSFLTTALVPLFVIVIMFGLGLSLTLNDFRRVAVYPRAIVVGLGNQLVLLPFLGFLLAHLLALPPELAVGLIIVTAVPGGPLSNVATNLLNLNTALSITLTALSSLAAFLTIPLWISLAFTQFTGAATAVAAPFAQLAVQVAVVTLLPVGLGVFVRSRWPGLAMRTTPLVRVGSGILIILAIAAFLIDQAETVASLLGQAGLAAVTLTFSATLLGYLTAQLFRLGHPTGLTIAIETGLQNVPLALVIAATVLGNPRLAVPAATYGLFSLVVLFSVLAGSIVSTQRNLRARVGDGSNPR